MWVAKSAISSFLPHDVDSYDFVHDTDPYTPMDIPQESDDE